MQRTSSDPHVEPFDATDLSGLVGKIAAVTEWARAKWEVSPKQPAYVRPAPSARHANVVGRGWRRLRPPRERQSRSRSRRRGCSRPGRSAKRSRSTQDVRRQDNGMRCPSSHTYMWGIPTFKPFGRRPVLVVCIPPCRTLPGQSWQHHLKTYIYLM